MAESGFSREVYARTVLRAVEICGGFEVLAAKLDEPPELVRQWSEGSDVPTLGAFLKAVDIVVGHDAEGRPRAAKPGDERREPR